MNQEIIEVPLSQLRVDPDNTRKVVEDESTEAMADSLVANGQLQPVTAEKLSDNEYLIMNGHRRKAGFIIIEKRTNKEPMVRVIVENKMTKEERLMKRCAIDAQQKNLSMEERDNAWEQLFEIKKGISTTEIAKMIGVSEAMVDEFLDRSQLDPEVIKGVPIANISETKRLDKEDRTKLLRKIQKKGITRKEIRATAKIMRTASPVLKDALIDDDIDFQKAEKMVGMSEDKQKIVLANIKASRQMEDEVIEQVKGTKGKEAKEKEKQPLLASEFVSRIEDEILNVSESMVKIKSVFEAIEEQKLSEHFNETMKKSLKLSSEEMTENIKPTLETIEKSITEWGI